MRSQAEILEEFSLFSIPIGGIGSWLTEQTHSDVFERVGPIDEDPLSAVQLNQLLVMGHEAPVGDGFFRHYWLQAPETHPYKYSRDSWLLRTMAGIQRDDRVETLHKIAHALKTHLVGLLKGID